MRTLLKYSKVLLMIVVLAVIDCGGDKTPYEPLPHATPHAAIVGGTVRDTEGHAMAGAIVALDPAADGMTATAKWLIDHPDATSGSAPGVRVTTTGDSGRYAFTNVVSGDYVLNVSAENHLGAVQSINVPPALTDTLIVDVNLTPTGDFAGNAFLEAASTHPNTVVYVQGTSYVAVTSPTGSYTIAGVPVGSYTVRAAHSGYLDETRSGAISSAGQTVTLSDMTLKIDLNIAPVARLTVPSQACTLDPVILSGATSTDADGTIMSYMWDFEDDGSVDFTSSTPAASHVYSPGTHRVKLRVTDDKGAAALAVATFNAVDAESLFVSATGNDSNPGTRSLPKQTIGAGITAAAANTSSCPKRVVVAGDHTESPVFVPGIDVLGGFSATTWTRAANSYSVVNVQNAPALASNINSATTTISGFDFRAANGQSGTPTQRNSVAMRVLSSSTLSFVDCRFQSGSGAAGPNGAAGSAGANGSPGVANTGHNGGAGGAAGSPGGFAGGNGATGTTAGAAGSGVCGGAGGIAGVSAPCSIGGYSGEPGGNGCSGTHGANAAAQNSYGTAAADWTPLAGFDGLTGTGGSGGGGGGGGGASLLDGNPICMFDPGGGGAGGGGGGGFASSGTGGGGGGASFAVYLYNSSPSFVDCRFTTGAGGAGGTGGYGGIGGNGGLGAIYVTGCCAGWGGNGGNGGAGGHGGAGSGGPGGLSFGVYRAGSSTPVINNATYSIGSGGHGGTGGVRADAVSAPAGPNGTTGNVGP